METTLFLACLCFSVAAFSQADSSRKFDFSKPGYFKQNNTLGEFRSSALKKIRPAPMAINITKEEENNVAAMPNAITEQQKEMFKPKEKYSIGNGMQAFESPLDAMKIISPDSTVLFKMPVALAKPMVLAITTTSP
jgi:hypothetical protein